MNTHLTGAREIILALEKEIKETIIGQDHLIRKIIISLFAGGHVLLEGVPGLGKTKTVKTIASVLGYHFKRVSFTPDLLPSDLTGTEIYKPQIGKFEIRKGPIFTNILLADEINRTPPKVQSALLEAMEEQQVTIGNDTLVLPSPFFVIATENPLEHEGTYPLPEAELDRFFMKIIIDYPLPEDEIKILSRMTEPESNTKKGGLLTPEELREMQDFILAHITIDEKIYDYISDILEATRSRGIISSIETLKSKKTTDTTRLQSEIFLERNIEYGASTRAGLALRDGARIVALLDGRDYVLPDDVKYIAPDILRHRIGRTYDAIAEKISTDDIIVEILESITIH